jgi:serine/threonine protein phosphatase PrpC
MRDSRRKGLIRDVYKPYSQVIGNLYNDSRISYNTAALLARNYNSIIARSFSPTSESRVLKKGFRLPELGTGGPIGQTYSITDRKLVVASTARLSGLSSKSALRSTSLGKGVKVKRLVEPPVNLSTSVLRCAYRTRKGSLGSNPKAHNQDTFLILPLHEGRYSCYVFGVFDGHGTFGHHVSLFVKDSVEAYCIEHRAQLMSQHTTKTALRACLNDTSQELTSSGIDLTFSGTTACLVHICENRITTANIGDSRAVIGGPQAKAFALTTDHKPDAPVERNRIMRRGGRVIQPKNAHGKPLGPSRVYLRDKDYPGLAMSRSIGDSVAHQAGVINEPGKV